MTDKIVKPTFEEWSKNQKCNDCSCPVSLEFKSYGTSTHKLRDVDFEKIKGYYCSECYEASLLKLKNKRFVERYKGQEIYFKEGNYSLWQSASYCKSLEDLHNWIDIRLNMLERASDQN
jgi:hypothetical protein